MLELGVELGVSPKAGDEDFLCMVQLRRTPETGGGALFTSLSQYPQPGHNTVNKTR